MNINIQELSDKKLLKDLKAKKIILGFYAMMIIILVTCAIIITINKGAKVFIFMPFVFTFFLFRSWRDYVKTKMEIKRRNLE
tara:strand:+ start:55 stop:300 length:246 start_codon:yes stop_codon:yes gene_type:complete